MSLLSWRGIAQLVGKLSFIWIALHGATASAALDYSTCRDFRDAFRYFNDNTLPVKVEIPSASQLKEIENSGNKAWFPTIYERVELDCADEEVTLHLRIASEDASNQIMRAYSSASVEKTMEQFACRGDGFIKKYGLIETRAIYDFDGQLWKKFSTTSESCDALKSPAARNNQRAETYLNAHQLKAFCASDSSSERSACQLYLAGLMDSYETLRHWGIAESRMCVPAGVSSEDLLNTVREWLSERPEEQLANDAAGPHAVNAIGEKWPRNREWKQLSLQPKEG